ncbi:hypothetical protein GXM_00851 [Nostoc sphaeroides CCNUC1]|uniref:Uncharacterized protein n=1 Tax=Nostoc sphaeroides CCNUC1 TaxID=2653204 RepID=A0A5P8VSE6_9NOSO|nr:hypothetical protein GXM_00851 [Nostoc sphaeroides CCNUC1]
MSQNTFANYWALGMGHWSLVIGRDAINRVCTIVNSNDK